APPVEEFAFRLWQGEKKLYILAPIVFLLYVSGYINWYLTGGAAVLALLYWCRVTKKYPMLVVLGTSICFAIIHLPQQWSATNALFLCLYLGLALIFSHIRLRHGFWYAVLFHFLWNLSVLAIGSWNHLIFRDVTTNIRGSSYTMSLTRQSVLRTSFGSNTYSGDDKITTSAVTKKALVQLMLSTAPDTVYIINTSPLERISLKVESIKGISLPQAEIRRELFTRLGVKASSRKTQKEGYRMQLRREAPGDTLFKASEINKASFAGYLGGFASELQERYHIPVTSAENPYIEIQYDESLDLKAQLADLQRRYGLQFERYKAEVVEVTLSD
ncbi:MAG: CPBP family intramembrane metalloprotease, partial [Sphingobacteriales bacterium]